MHSKPWLHNYPIILPSQIFTYPDNVAFPFGGEGNSEYIVMELHYDNPREIEGKTPTLENAQRLYGLIKSGK